MKPVYSIVVPVYNRPDEIDELLASIAAQDFKGAFEVILVEDGSTEPAEEVVKKYQEKIVIHYFKKENSGAGASRNFGMQQAAADYFIILDSDVLLPREYLTRVDQTLQDTYTDAFGGPDTAHPSFTPLQKAINYSMTSFLTTGGLRGKKKGIGTFQPRSFNFGISKKAFEATQGFSNLRIGEDIDLTFRLWEAGFKTQLISEAYVYHKRRNTLPQFYKQTFAFGGGRPLLNSMYPSTAKFTYWVPTLFILGLDMSLIFLFFGYPLGILCYAGYFGLVFLDALFQTKSLWVALLSILTSATQWFGYGLGFLESQLFPTSNTASN